MNALCMRKSGPRPGPTNTAMAALAEETAHLDEHGWCVLKGVVSEQVAADSRAMMDDHLGPVGVADIQLTPDREAAVGGLLWGQKNVSWPEPGASGGGGPVIHTGGSAHSLQHPLYDARTAAVVGPMAAPMMQILRSTPETLKLVHQNYRRTDPSPGPYPDYINTQPSQINGAEAGFHM